MIDQLSWYQFKTLNHIKNLSLNEQVNQYNQYLNHTQVQYFLNQSNSAGAASTVDEQTTTITTTTTSTTTTTTTEAPTPLTLEFSISSESGTNVLLNLATVTDKSVDATVEWDEFGLVLSGSISETIAANTTWSPTIDLGAATNNVPFRIILSDSSAIRTITWTASNDDSGPNEYQIWTAPSNFSALQSLNLATFEYQAVESLDLSSVVSAAFRWAIDILISSVNLTNVNIADLAFTDCTSLTSLTLTGLNYGNESGGYSFDFYNCALNQASVIGLLTAADASGYENGLIDVSNGIGSGNYAPSGAEELALVTSLQGKGWTITVN